MAWFESTRESDLRKSRARTLYDFEVECRWQGWGDPACVFDEEKDLFRLTDGRFASCLECPCACIGGWVFVGYIRRARLGEADVLPLPPSSSVNRLLLR